MLLLTQDYKTLGIFLLLFWSLILFGEYTHGERNKECPNKTCAYRWQKTKKIFSHEDEYMGLITIMYYNFVAKQANMGYYYKFLITKVSILERGE